MVNVTYLLLELILADQLADLPPQLESCCGEEWQFYISIITANTGRLTGRSIPKYSHLLLNFTFLIFELILADQLADLPPTIRVMLCWRMAILHFYYYS